MSVNQCICRSIRWTLGVVPPPRCILLWVDEMWHFRLTSLVRLFKSCPSHKRELLPILILACTSLAGCRSRSENLAAVLPLTVSVLLGTDRSFARSSTRMTPSKGEASAQKVFEPMPIAHRVALLPLSRHPPK